MSPIDWTSATIEAVGNHLWQSTLFAVAVGLVTLSLRHHRAGVRYWLWMAASVKFLIPFATLIAIGHELSWRSPVTIAQPDVALLIDTISQPFSRSEWAANGTAPSLPIMSGVAGVVPILLVAIWFGGSASILTASWIRWRELARMVQRALPVNDGREVDTFRDVVRSCGLKRPLSLVSSRGTLEPGIFGIVKPVLLWPPGIGDCLSEGQIKAIIAHEVCHVRRRDNAAGAVHMFVEAVFWFYPLVWWLGARLVDERERACDEEVLRLGTDPQVYAESILKTCRYFVASPLACVAGVTGSDLKKRIEEIMSSKPAGELTRWRRCALATAGFATITAPIALGALTQPAAEVQIAPNATSAPAFEVASVKMNKSREGLMRMQIQPGGRMNVTNASLRTMIRNAYRVQDSQIVGGPEWLSSDRFDIIAKAEGNPTGNQMSLMLRALLAERFKLTLHNETRPLPIFALVVARADGTLGPEIRKAAFDCTASRNGPPTPSPAGNPFNCGFRVGAGTMTGRGSSMSALASSLSNWVNRVVLDRTGLAGDFDLDLEWTPEQPPQGLPPGAPPLPPADSDGPSIFTAVQEQLGLKLEPQRGPVDVLVVDSAERPIED